MAIIIKRKTAVGLGRETNYKTESTQLVNFGVQDITIDIQKTTILNQQMYARIEDTRDSRIGTEMAQVTLSGIVESAFFGQFFRAALGTLATTDDTPESGANTHAFSVLNTNQHPSYSIIYDDGNQDMVVLGARLQSLKKTIVAGDWVNYEAVFVGNPPSTASESASYVDDFLFSADQATVRMAAVGGSFSGAGIALSSLDITINKNTEPYFAFGAKTPNNVINKQFSVAGTFSLLHDDSTYYDLFRNHTLNAMEIVLSGGTIPATSTPYSVKIVLPQIHLSTWDNNGGAEEVVTQNIAFNAEYEESASAMITAQLINDQAGTAY